MPLSTLFQLYRSGQILLEEETGGAGKTTDLSHLSHNVVHLALIKIRTHNISGDKH